MAHYTPAETGDSPQEPSEKQAWPEPRTAWYAVSVFAIALMFAFLDRGIMTLLVEPIKADLQLSDFQISLLLGFALVVFNAFVAVPASRFVDIWPRNIIITVGIAFWSTMTALCGMAQNFWQLFMFRMGIGVGEIVHGPATYSMMADFFPREKLPRAIAVLQLGFIGGLGASLLLGAFVIQMLLGIDNVRVPGTDFVIRNWQLVFIIVGLPGLLVAALMMTVPEPPRRGRIMTQMKKPLPLRTVLKYLFTHWRLYAPQFFGLAIAAIESSGVRAWQPVFFQRTYDWSAQKTGLFLGTAFIIAAPIGLWLATWLTEHYAKTRDDANLRVVAIAYTLSPILAISGPLMPNPWLALLCASGAFLIGIGGAVPQNAALQSVTPNEMRGQVTALYLFIFSVIGGGIGPSFIALFTDYVIGDEMLLRYALSVSAAIMMPIAAWIMWSGVKHYGTAIAAVKIREQTEGA
ncbi:MAG: MFS transporter [Gammaproteobacteria bacterium]|nr:MFS transporter [Gammaproteobacteria bacterium]MDH4253305.1 MFS transporter [Gammaproteobacteria bacterium]MDH5310537.1 MFS transporter [Gammaproteobacteria bacterium]